MTDTPNKKSRLDIPCIILDLDVLDKNLRKMQNLADQYGKNLRPHAKTHKCSELAKRQIEEGAIGACVAKVSEAEALVKAGVTNILITGQASTPHKVRRLVEILKLDRSLMVAVDHHKGVDMLSEALTSEGVAMDVLLDIDVGLNRTGATPQNAMALANHILSKTNLRLRGIQAYAGHIQHIPSYHSRKDASRQCLQLAVPIFRKLKAITEDCNIFSSTGTGTADIDALIPEVTELQVGSYACMDVEYNDIGARNDDTQFSTFPPALRLLTSVVSANQKDFVTVDAGLKALYRDGGVPRIISPQNRALEYDWFGDEYGKISSANNSELPQLGDVLEVMASHCDPTINQFDKFYLTRGEEVTGIWPTDLRGCCQ